MGVYNKKNIRLSKQSNPPPHLPSPSFPSPPTLPSTDDDIIKLLNSVIKETSNNKKHKPIKCSKLIGRCIPKSPILSTAKPLKNKIDRLRNLIQYVGKIDKKNNKNHKKKGDESEEEEEDEEEEEEEDDEENEDEDSEEEDEDSEEEDEDSEEEDEESEEEDEESEKEVKKKVGKEKDRRKHEMESNRYSDSDNDSDDYYDIYLSEKEALAKRTLSRLNDTTLCDSDDEKTFMKESYSDICHDDIKEKKKQMKTIVDPSGFESQYKDLLDVNQYLCTKLVNNSEPETIVTALKYFNDIKKKFITKARKTNATNYYNLIKDKEYECEVDYFKTKLSNIEQQSIIKELSLINNDISINKPYRLSLLQSTIPTKFKTIVLQKMNTLYSMSPDVPDYQKQKHWIDTFLRIPFSIYRNLPVKIEDGKTACCNYMIEAKQTLDKCVYGHDNAKIQILQLIGQWITNPSAVGSAIAIQGPPGSGKTSLVRDGISKILGREFAFIALGGGGDSSFLEGHSYTYEGSTWGRIVQILIETKCMNPVIYFDELDKVSDSARGQEIMGILTHLTDTSQNDEFHDKY